MIEQYRLFKEALGSNDELKGLTTHLSVMVSNAAETFEKEVLENGIELSVASSTFSNPKILATIDGYSCNLTSYLYANLSSFLSTPQETMIQQVGSTRAREDKVYKTAFALQKLLNDLVQKGLPDTDEAEEPEFAIEYNQNSTYIRVGTTRYPITANRTLSSRRNYFTQPSLRRPLDQSNLNDKLVNGISLIQEVFRPYGGDMSSTKIYSKEGLNFKFVEFSALSEYSFDEPAYAFGFSQYNTENATVLMCYDKDTADFFAKELEYSPIYVQCRYTGIYYNIEETIAYKNFSISSLSHFTPYSAFQAAKALTVGALFPPLHFLLFNVSSTGCYRCGDSVRIFRDKELFDKLVDEFGVLFSPTYIGSVVLEDETLSDDGHQYCPSCFADIKRLANRFKDVGITNYVGGDFWYDGALYSSDGDGVGNYDREPYIEFYGEDDDLHLGVEVELDAGGEDDRVADIVTALMGSGTYAMSDGSLNDGFEVATMPATLDYHMSEINYRDAFKVAVGLGYRAHDTTTCGIHVHFDKGFFGVGRQTQELKATYLTYIMEHNWEKFRKFARRDYSSLNQWATKKNLIQDIYADDNEDTIVSKFKDKYDHDKYVALNTCHSHTYELRIFRGTLKYDTYIAILQFVDNLVKLSKSITSITKAQQVTFKDIIDFKPWDTLVEYCNERGLM